MLLLDAGDLFAQCFVDEGEWVGGGGVGDGVVDGVDAEEKVFWAEVVVEAGGAEVFADVSASGCCRHERCRPPSSGPLWTGQQLRSRASTLRPQADGARRAFVGDERDVAEAEVLAVAFVVAEEEELVLADGAAERSAEVVALEAGESATGRSSCGRRARCCAGIRTRRRAADWSLAVTMRSAHPAACRRRRSRCRWTTLNSRTASTPRNWPLVPPGVTLMSDAPVYSTPLSRKRLSCGTAAGDGEHVADRGVRGSDAAGALARCS